MSSCAAVTECKYSLLKWEKPKTLMSVTQYMKAEGMFDENIFNC